MVNNYVKCIGDMQSRAREVVFFFDDTDPNSVRDAKDASAEYVKAIVSSGRRAPARSVWHAVKGLPFSAIAEDSSEPGPDCGDPTCAQSGTAHADCDLTPEQNAEIVGGEAA